MVEGWKIKYVYTFFIQITKILKRRVERKNIFIKCVQPKNGGECNIVLIGRTVHRLHS